MKMSKIYKVSVVPKKPDHLFFGQGSKGAFTFNGKENKTLKLIRGCEYKFNVQAPTHPLYFTTSSIGGESNRDKSLMGENEIPTDEGIVTFFIRNDLPDTFYYQCWNHPNMGGKVMLVKKNLLGCVLLE
jgi:hypothetical protein